MNILEKIRPSFKSILRQFDLLKKNVSEWVVAIDTKQYEQEKRIEELEQRVGKLESFNFTGGNEDGLLR